MILIFKSDFDLESKSFYSIKNDLDHFEKDFDFDFSFFGKTIFDFDLDRLEKRFRNCLFVTLTHFSAAKKFKVFEQTV